MIYISFNEPNQYEVILSLKKN